MGRGEGVETKGRTFTSRAERWEGGREGERKRKKERVGCTKYQRTILQSKQDGGCHTAYPRLNATSYFESSSNASLSLPSPGVPLAVSLPSSSAFLQTGCTDVIATPLLPRFFSSTDERKAIPPRKRGGMVARLRPSCFEFCERTASSLDAVLFNLEERKDIGRVAGQDWNERERRTVR